MCQMFIGQTVYISKCNFCSSHNHVQLFFHLSLILSKTSGFSNISGPSGPAFWTPAPPYSGGTPNIGCFGPPHQFWLFWRIQNNLIYILPLPYVQTHKRKLLFFLNVVCWNLTWLNVFNFCPFIHSLCRFLPDIRKVVKCPRTKIQQFKCPHIFCRKNMQFQRIWYLYMTSKDLFLPIMA